MLSWILKQFFRKEFCYQTIVVSSNTKSPKYNIWKMSLSNIQYTVEKTDILLLLILPYNKINISNIINILWELMY